ncbi:MAG: AAA family ATPase [Candidatus Magasanikbacteria bacterium]|nr:AAA family ATPase [Candidatus Magasanikbacteria bacterium]
MIIGHQRLQEYFAGLAPARWSHLYVLVGPAQVGKRALARQLAARWFGITPEKLAGHPDFCYLERSVDAKSGEFKKEITVAQARQLRSLFSLRSWGEGGSVAVIDEAERLNSEAGNALLKILEEPRGKLVVFLLTESLAALLPTIRSRAAALYLAPLPEAELRVGLQSQGFAAPEIDEAVAHAAGCPGRALEFLQNPERLKILRAARSGAARLAAGSLPERFAGAAELVKQAEATADATGYLLTVIGEWELFWQQQLQVQLPAAGAAPAGDELGQPAARRSLPQLVTILRGLERVQSLLWTNAQRRLLLEQALLEW